MNLSETKIQDLKIGMQVLYCEAIFEITVDASEIKKFHKAGVFVARCKRVDNKKLFNEDILNNFSYFQGNNTVSHQVIIK
jgi:hypothetical protein